MGLHESLRRVSAQIAAVLEVNARAKSHHTGTVIQVNPSGDGNVSTVTVDLDGSGSWVDLPYLSHYSPQPGDYAHIDAVGPTMWAVGALQRP